MQRMDMLALFITMKKPINEKVEPPFKEVVIGDSSQGSLPITEGSLMMIEEEQRIEQRMRRPSKVEDNDEGPLVFKQIKRVNVGDVLETSKDLEAVEREIHKDTQSKIWRGEEPSDPNAEI